MLSLNSPFLCLHSRFVGIGYHLQILSNGTIGGVHEPNEHSFLKLFAMRRGGVVGIRGIKSGLYLCMSREGVAHGAGQFSSDCLFKESLEENFYTTFSSLSHPGIYLALSHKGEAKRGTSVGRHQTCTHFLPRRAPNLNWWLKHSMAEIHAFKMTLDKVQQGIKARWRISSLTEISSKGKRTNSPGVVFTQLDVCELDWIGFMKTC
uniref:Fibroblast growth factor n=1 Tax=Esox lucius TaxID=8010 RepID=A0A6Q2Y4X6_ESOLU